MRLGGHVSTDYCNPISPLKYIHSDDITHIPCAALLQHREKYNMSSCYDIYINAHQMNALLCNNERDIIRLARFSCN